MKFYPYSKQTINQKEINAVIKTLKSDFITQGPKIVEFEKKFSNFVGSKYAVACSSGTAALHLSCLALGLKKKSNVAIPTITFLATANCTQFSHDCIVNFVDTEKNSACISVAHLEKILKTKSISLVVVVHMSGQIADLKKIYDLKKKYGFKLIEDSCHALGGYYYKTKIGSCQFSDISTFSFHPVKHITTGEGGMITTNNKDIYEKLILHRVHGMHKNNKNFVNYEYAFDEKNNPNRWYYEMSHLGYNYRITDIQAAIGIEQLKKLDNFVDKRRRIAEIYNNELKGNPYIQIYKNKKYTFNVFHLYTILINFKKIKKSRNKVMSELLNKGVGSQVLYIPVHKQPFYKNKINKKLVLNNAENYYAKCLSIPIYPSLKISEVKKISKIINKVVSP